MAAIRSQENGFRGYSDFNPRFQKKSEPVGLIETPKEEPKRVVPIDFTMTIAQVRNIDALAHSRGRDSLVQWIRPSKDLSGPKPTILEGGPIKLEIPSSILPISEGALRFALGLLFGSKQAGPIEKGIITKNDMYESVIEGEAAYKQFPTHLILAVFTYSTEELNDLVSKNLYEKAEKKGTRINKKPIGFGKESHRRLQLALAFILNRGIQDIAKNGTPQPEEIETIFPPLTRPKKAV